MAVAAVLQTQVGLLEGGLPRGGGGGPPDASRLLEGDLSRAAFNHLHQGVGAMTQRLRLDDLAVHG